MLRKVPLVVILGSTGTGKTKLSIELAQRFGGLDIATAKATKEEQAAAPHHLLDIAIPGQPFTVVNFRDAALPIHGVSLTVGICLNLCLVVSQELKHVELSDLLKMSAVQMANIDSVELHRHLMVVDSVTANRMHPNNKRKIIR
uniref:CSON011506 protein n=1 Tax=Culicoides sonorensis TaxID=179676 RepID=A0A336M7E5_CULSO